MGAAFSAPDNPRSGVNSCVALATSAQDCQRQQGEDQAGRTDGEWFRALGSGELQQDRAGDDADREDRAVTPMTVPRDSVPLTLFIQSRSRSIPGRERTRR